MGCKEKHAGARAPIEILGLAWGWEIAAGHRCEAHGQSELAEAVVAGARWQRHWREPATHLRPALRR